MKLLRTKSLYFLITGLLSFAIQGYNSDELDCYERCMQAIDNYDIDGLGRLLPSVDIHRKNKYGSTLLHQAIPDGRLEFVKLLVKNGADINAQDDQGYTPLYYVFDNLIATIGMSYADGMAIAAEVAGYFNEYLRMAEYLVQSGANLSFKYQVDVDEYNLPVHVPGVGYPAALQNIISGFIQYYVHDLPNLSKEEKKATKKLLRYLKKLHTILVVSNV